MLQSVLALWGDGSLASAQELQQLLLYFYTHAGLGLFFVLQVLGLLVTKARADSVNNLGSLHAVQQRRVFGVAHAVFGRARVNLFHYGF